MYSNVLSVSKPTEYWCKKPTIINKALSAKPVSRAIFMPLRLLVPLPKWLFLAPYTK